MLRNWAKTRVCNMLNIRIKNGNIITNKVKLLKSWIEYFEKQTFAHSQIQKGKEDEVDVVNK